MDNINVTKKFIEIGARVKIFPAMDYGYRKDPDLAIDIRRDKEGEYFKITARKSLELNAIDVQKKDRHLLLHAKLAGNPRAKFLCGHDERHWFSCAVPESAGVSTVFQAKQALKPQELQRLESIEGISKKVIHKHSKKLDSGRKVPRQGEFFFIQDSSFEPPKNAIVYKREPMRGGGLNIHTAEFLYRTGGIPVMVKGRSIISPGEFEKLDISKKHGYMPMMQNPTVYVKGNITHPQHSTVRLGSMWHKVLLNTENMSFAKRSVMFLD